MEEEEEDYGVCWADLPVDVFLDIAGRLNSLDYLAIRSVCSSWRRSATSRGGGLLSPFLPVKVHPPDFSPGSLLSQSLADCVLCAGSVFLLRAPAGSSCSSEPEVFLLFAGEFVERKFWLRNLLARSLVSDLHFYMPDMLNLLDFHAVEVGRHFGLASVPFNYKSMPPLSSFDQVIKVLVPSNGCKGKAIVVTDTGAIQVVNFGAHRWIELGYSPDLKFDDIVEFEGKIFLVDRGGLLFLVKDECSLNLSLVAVPEFFPGDRRKRFVLSSGELYLIVSCDVPGLEGKRGLVAFKLKLGEFEWDQVTSLGDQIFFLGKDLSFSFSSKGVEGSCPKSSILSTQDSFPCYQEMDNAPREKGAKNDLEVDIFYLGKGGDDRISESFSAYSNLFWPLPTWLL